MHHLNGALPLPYVPSRVTRCALVAHRHSLAPPRCRTSTTVEPLWSSQCLFETIFVALYLMVWDWRGLRAEPLLSCWLNQLFLFFSYYFLFFFLPWVGCVGFGSSDWQSILTVSRPCTADSILIIIIIIFYKANLKQIRLNELKHVQCWIDAWLKRTDYKGQAYHLLSHPLQRSYQFIGEIRMHTIKFK